MASTNSPHAPAPVNHRIWIDLDNTPHVPFFKPIIAELEARGYTVFVTARDAFQVCDLADRMGVRYRKIGRHYGKHKLVKVMGLFFRAAQMLPTALRLRPAVAVSHGARSQIIVSNLLGIPSILLADYEFAKYPPLMRPTWEMVPEVIPNDHLYCPPERVRKYPGIKEDVYVSGFRPDPAIREELGLNGARVVVTVRPPATEAHYHNPESEKLFTTAMDLLTSDPGVKVVLLPRNHKQTEAIRAAAPGWFGNGQVVVPARAVDGLNLLHHSDLAISGGGTMNREAAALGVPVYSIFRGAIGAVDRHLAETGRLVLLESEQDVRSLLRVVPRERPDQPPTAGHVTLDRLVGHVTDILAYHEAKRGHLDLAVPEETLTAR